MNMKTFPRRLGDDNSTNDGWVLKYLGFWFFLKCAGHVLCFLCACVYRRDTNLGIPSEESLILDKPTA